jgi:hypothetical protein
MIASLSNQPDVKAYISESDISWLIDTGILAGKIYLHTKDTVGTLLITVDWNIKNWAERLYDKVWQNDVSVALSPEIRDELIKEGFVWWMRMNWVSQKLTLVIRERIGALKISSDDKMNLEWWLDSLMQNPEMN